MRISTTMMMKRYGQVLNSKYEEINKYGNQISTTRAFEHASEDPVAAMQTIKSCHEYTENQQYQNSVSQTSSWINATETTVTEINDIVKTATEKATEMTNGTNSSSDLQNFSVAIKSYRDEIVSTLNTTFGGQYIFGGNSKGPAPFKLDSSGNLQYYNYNAATPSYVNVSSLTKSDVNAANLSMPIDLGLGLTASGGNIDKGSAFEASTSGLDAIISDFNGTGGTAGNIVDNLTAVINNLSSGNTNGLKTIIGSLSNAQNSILKVKVALGEKSNMLTEINTRLTDNESNITDSLANSMEVDSTEAIMNYNISQLVYKESMSISSTILQQSLIDFLK